MKSTLCFLILVSMLIGQTNIDLGFPKYDQLKLDKKKTTQSILLLSILTILPLLNLTRLNDSPEFRNEIYISTAIFSLPATFGWPLFIRDFMRYKKSKKKSSIILAPKTILKKSSAKR